MNAKALFLKDGDLAKWWAPIAHDDRLEKVLLYARNAITDDATVTPEQLHGVRRLADALLTIADNDTAGVEFPSPGLHHDAQVLRKPDPVELPPIETKPATPKPTPRRKR